MAIVKNGFMLYRTNRNIAFRNFDFINNILYEDSNYRCGRSGRKGCSKRNQQADHTGGVGIIELIEEGGGQPRDTAEIHDPRDAQI